MATVSVIITTYNRAHLVTRAVDSLLSQTRIPDEILVVVDGSTDHTIEVLQQYTAPVRVVTQENKDRSAARNHGLRLTQTDLITFLDDDDTLPRNSIEVRAAFLESHPDVDVVYSDVMLIDSFENRMLKFSEWKRYLPAEGNVFFSLTLNNLAPPHAFMFRRECLTAGIQFDETMRHHEDHEFWLRIAENHSFAYIDLPLAEYHYHEGMTTTRESDAMRVGFIRVQENAVTMHAFQSLAPSQQAQVYCSIGGKYAVMGKVPEARLWLTRAIHTNPPMPKAMTLWLFTLLGTDGMQQIAKMRRRLRSIVQGARSLYRFDRQK
jgi:glycosyltransferase involved in cell wall biosynthesis